MQKYSCDLAYVHDTSYGNFAQEASIMIIKSFKEHAINKGLIVDLGCGSGILAKRLFEAGYDVFGIDQSKNFIDISHKKVPKGTFVLGSFFDTSLPNCIGVASTGECLNYLFDEKNSEESLLCLFEKVFKALERGGLFIFDILEPNTHNPREYKKIIEANDWTMFLHVSENLQNQTLTRNIVLFRKFESLYRKTNEIHNVKLYPRKQILLLLQKIGFEVSLFNQYGNLILDNNHAGFICQKLS